MAMRRVILATLIALSCLGFTWPFIVSNSNLAEKSSWFFLASAPVALLLILVLTTQEELGSKNIAFLGVLTALIAALRPLGIGAIGIEPMWFALILASRAMGPSFGFLLGCLSMTLSAFLTGGIGPWLAYQVFAAALIGWGTGIIPKNLRGKGELILLALYGVIASELFGIAMDLQFWPWALGSGTELSYIPGASIGDNLANFFAYHFLSSLAWDIPRAILTGTLILISGRAILGALRRARQKAAFVNVRATQP